MMELPTGRDSSPFLDHSKHAHHVTASLFRLRVDNLPPAADGGIWEGSASLYPDGRPLVSREGSIYPSPPSYHVPSATDPGESASFSTPLHPIPLQPHQPLQPLSVDPAPVTFVSDSGCSSRSGSDYGSDQDFDGPVPGPGSGPSSRQGTRSVKGRSSSRTSTSRPGLRSRQQSQQQPQSQQQRGSAMAGARERRSSLSTLLASLGPGYDLGAEDDGISVKQRKEQAQLDRAREAIRDHLVAKRLLDPQLCPKGPKVPFNTAQGPSPLLHQTANGPPSQRFSASGSTLNGGGAGAGGGAAFIPPAAARRHSQPQLDFALPSTRTGGGPGGNGIGGGGGGGLRSSASSFSVSGPGPGPKGLRQPSYSSAASAPNSPMAAAAARRRQMVLEVNSGGHVSYYSGGGGSYHQYGSAAGLSPRRSGGGGGGGGATVGAPWQRNSVTGCSISGASTTSLTALAAGIGGGIGQGVPDGLAAGLGRLRSASCTVSDCGLGALRRPGLGGGGCEGSEGEEEGVWEEGEEEEGVWEEDGNVADLGTLVRSERKRLALVQSKVTGTLKSQQRYQGLLANAPGAPVKGALTPTDEELTAAIIPTAAKPPEGVELKVRQDDIRFSGVRLRFLMGLLEALDPHPDLFRSTSDLVSQLVVPLTADHRCRLLDLVPPQHRGQPHHYICHAWPCSARELLHTLRREMLPHPPPRPPAPMGAGGGAAGGGGGPGQHRTPGPGPAHSHSPPHPHPHSQHPGGGAGGGGGRVPGSLPPGAHLPHLGGGSGGGGMSYSGGGSAAPADAMAAHDADAGGGYRTVLPTIGGGGSGSGGSTGGGEGGSPGASVSGGQWMSLNGGMPQPPGGGSGGGESGRSAEVALRQLHDTYKKDLHRALDQVVWIDFVCNNQHTQAKKDYGKVSRTVVSCGATVLVLDPDLTALTRTWCLFEVMHCLRCKRHLKVFRAQPPPARPAAAQQPHPPQPQAPGGGSGGGSTGRPGGPQPQPPQRPRPYGAVRPPFGGMRAAGMDEADMVWGGEGVGGRGGGVLSEAQQWDRVVETISIAESRASSEADRVGILQEVLNTVGTAYVDELVRGALRLSNSERARQLAIRRQQLRTTLELLQPDPAVIGTEQYEGNMTKCREHLTSVLEAFYPQDMLRCIIPRDYVSDSARCWDMLSIFAEILDREQFREDAKVLRGLAWLIFKRHSKRYIEVLYEKELENWLVDSLERDRKWRRTQAKLKHDAQKKWT